MKRLLFLLIMLLLLSTWVQICFKPFGVPPLMGVFQSPKEAPPSIESIVSEQYQKYISHQAQVALGFAPSMIRLANSINFSLFDILNSTVVRGKGNVLFENGYIQSYQGQDFLGEEELEKRIEEFNEWLRANKLEQKVIVVLAPNKAELQKDFLPEAVVPGKRNHPEMKAALEASGIMVLDTREWFLQLPAEQSTTAYGTHWSMHGAALVADSLVKMMNQLNHDLHLKTEITILERSPEPRFTDNDLERLLNLMYPLPKQSYQYITLNYTAEKKPVVLGIGDSYYWSLYDLDMVSQLFDQSSEYWYYGHELYDINKLKKPEDHGELMQAPHKADFIIIVATEPNLIRFPFGLGQKE